MTNSDKIKCVENGLLDYFSRKQLKIIEDVIWWVGDLSLKDEDKGEEIFLKALEMIDFKITGFEIIWDEVNEA